MAKILIVGCGDIGGGLGVKMAKQGHDVYGLRRSEQTLPGVSCIQGDVAEMESLIGKFPDKIDYLIYSVASSEFSEEGYERFYVQGLTHILALLQQMQQSPKRIFFVSSTSVFPHHDGCWVDETTLADPVAFAGIKMLAAEQKLQDSDFNGTAVRFSGIYGHGRTRLISQARSGNHCDPEPDIWTNRIHNDDCIGVLQYLIEQDIKGTKLDTLYLASDKEPVPLFKILEWLKDRIGDVEPDHDVPEVSRRGSKRCSSARLQKLGYKFKYATYKKGYEKVLNEMGY